MLTDHEKEKLIPRLKKITGQVNGIEKMLNDNRYCVDILQQILAARAALSSVAFIILESHAKTCVVTAIKEDRAEQSMNELLDVLKQFTKLT